MYVNTGGEGCIKCDWGWCPQITGEYTADKTWLFVRNLHPQQILHFCTARCLNNFLANTDNISVVKHVETTVCLARTITSVEDILAEKPDKPAYIVGVDPARDYPRQYQDKVNVLVCCITAWELWCRSRGMNRNLTKVTSAFGVQYKCLSASMPSAVNGISAQPYIKLPVCVDHSAERIHIYHAMEDDLVVHHCEDITEQYVG